MLGRLALVLPLLTSSGALAEPAILLFPAVGRAEQVTVSGRVLKEAPGKGSSTLSRNLRRLLAPNWEGAPVEVELLGLSAKARSGHDGSFVVTFSAPFGRPFPAGVHLARAKVPGASAQTAVELVADQAPFVVISDFDDTLAVTGVLDKGKLIESALLEDANSQPVVEGMAAWYRCLKADKEAPPAFALVSGSPVQYVPRTMAFLKRHSFPFFGMYLRDLGPGTLSGYKQPVIRALLERLPHPVVLVGDSGEHDPEVYAEIRAAFPGRVRRIYIRDVGRAEEEKRFEGMVLFKEPRRAAEDAAEQGLVTRECVAASFKEQAR